MVSTPFFHSHCFNATKVALTSSITLMPKRIQSPSCSSHALPSPLHAHLQQPLPCTAPIQEEFLTAQLHFHLEPFLQKEEALVSCRTWPRAQWCLCKRPPEEGTLVFHKPEMSCKLGEPHAKGSALCDTKESQPDHLDEGNTDPVIRDLNIISASVAYCKLFCNLSDYVWYLDSVSKRQIEGYGKGPW